MRSGWLHRRDELIEGQIEGDFMLFVFNQRQTMNIFRFCCLCTVIALLNWSGAASAQIVEIPDPNLKQAIREALNLPVTEPLTQQNLLTLKKLRADNRGITDLTGLEHARNLEWLLVWNNLIFDVSPLSNLTKLQHLNLGGCQISDLSPLAGLTKLTALYLHSNQISDIKPLAGLTQLTHLWLNGNRIVEVGPLSNLTNLTELIITGNPIVDFTPLEGLPLTRFEHDEPCELPAIPVHERIANRSSPSVFSAWAGIGWSSILNLPNLSDTGQLALHDLFFSTPHFKLNFVKLGETWQVMGYLEEAQERRDAFVAVNPNMIFLVEIRIRDAFDRNFPEDWPYWLRDANGNRVAYGSRGLFLIDFTQLGMQDAIVQQAIAVANCGLYDGIFFDWWNEHGVVLADSKVGWRTGYRSFEAEQRARDNIIRRIRAAVRDDFLIMGNGNRRTFPRNAPYMNGSFMETLRDDPGGYTHDGLIEIESTLLWLEQNLRAPQINCLEGFGIPTESPDSPDNRRFMRVFTTMSLTHSDGYVLYNIGDTHAHYWYAFWDADLGKPIGSKAQEHQNVEGLFIREFTNGWAVYNRSGHAQALTLPSSATSVSDRGSTAASITHLLPDLDGEIYLKARHPADVNGDWVVNILDLIQVSNSFGKSSPDLNSDGAVNILDLVFVIEQFSE